MTAPRLSTFRKRAALRRHSLGTLALAVPLLGWGAAAARAEDLKVHYDVSLIGLPIGSALLTGSVEPKGYKLDLSAKVSGLASVLSTSHGAASATGSFAGPHLAPASFATTSANSTMSRTIRIAMDGGAVKGVDIAPPFDPAIKRVPILPEQIRSVIDPLSAFLMTVPPGPALIGPAACDRTLPMFDGGTRFDVVLSFVGTRHVKLTGYDGEVAVCSARYVPISGQRENSRASQFWADNRNLEAWVAPVGGSRVVIPLRISARTMIGTVLVDADNVGLDGATHASR